MNGRTNAKNNSGGKTFAAISVTYPAIETGIVIADLNIKHFLFIIRRIKI